jgi:hypothetical protein
MAGLTAGVAGLTGTGVMTGFTGAGLTTGGNTAVFTAGGVEAFSGVIAALFIMVAISSVSSPLSAEAGLSEGLMAVVVDSCVFSGAGLGAVNGVNAATGSSGEVGIVTVDGG